MISNNLGVKEFQTNNQNIILIYETPDKVGVKQDFPLYLTL